MGCGCDHKNKRPRHMETVLAQADAVLAPDKKKVTDRRKGRRTVSGPG